MEDRANGGKKSPLDDIINHMTGEWSSYSLPPGGPAQAPPRSANVWSKWEGQGPDFGQATAPNSGQGPGSGPGPGQGRQYYRVGGEPALPVFFQADQPPPYQVEPQAGNAQEFFNQPFSSTAQGDGNDLGGTVVNIGGGSFIKVRYREGLGGTVNPQYLPVNPNSAVLPPSLENILPHSNQSEPNLQPNSISGNYGLFRDMPSQQVQTMIRQSHLQLRAPESDSPQHQQRPTLQQHAPPGLIQPSQTLFNDHLQNQQFHQMFSVAQPQQFHHDLLRAQRQQLEQQQLLQQQQQPLQQQQQSRQEPSPIPPEGGNISGSKTSASTFTQNQDQLIQNLIGNWTVPNQTGCYNPFGLALTDNNDPPQEDVKEVEPIKKNDKSVRRTRIVAEVRPMTMRPSYSAVLTTPSPSPSPLKPNLSSNALNSSNGQNNTCNSVQISNATNKQTSDTSRPKSTSSNSKGKNSSSKSNGVVNPGGKLKRQHSNGSEEPSLLGNRTGSSSNVPKSSGLSSSSSGDLDESILGQFSPTSLSRRWVSLDDLESDVSNDTSNVFSESGSTPEPGIREAQTSDKRSVDKARSSTRAHVKQSSSYVADEACLNNIKAPSGTGSSKGGSSVGSSSNKRPIHINNNLGTNHGSHWANQNASAQASNASKGDKLARSSKSTRPASDERKVFKNEGKVIVGGSSSSGISGRSGRGSTGSMADRAAVLQGKRNQRGSRRKDGVAAATLVIKKYGQLALAAIIWFFHLLSDVVGMSFRLSLHLCIVFWENWVLSTASWLVKCFWRIPHSLPEQVVHSRVWRFICRCLGKNDPGEQSRNSSKKGSRGSEGNVIPGGLSHNISMPSTGEEAMKRLLACKGKDPYSILGVTPTCSDDDVKKYYKRQAFLVHPDKNNQPGAEEAFKILVHAFELIGEPEKRAEYDRYVAETQQVEQAWSELSDLLSQLQHKMEYAANTIRCTNCGKRHKRIAVPRKPFAARFCAQCKIKHSAKEGDIWAETMVMGFLWHYYACMEGAVYDITDWASCQTNNLRHLKPNSHTVQYRIVLGRQRQQNPRTPSEPDLENFLSSLYNQGGGPGKGAPSATDSPTSTNIPNRQDTARNRKKVKRNK